MQVKVVTLLQRKITEKLQAWKRQSERKALLVTGARQIGKSYAIRAFGAKAYPVYVEINLLEDARARQALLEASDAAEFIRRLSILVQRDLVPGQTLIFIDEVQEAPDIMTMAKFLVEDGRFDWAFSGSMLGTELRGVRSYPVGYVRELTMRPLDFEEFCWAIGVTDGAMAQVRTACADERPVASYLHDAMLLNFRTYLVVGGMPEVVQRFLDTDGDLAGTRSLQSELNAQYRRDISKYAGSRALYVQSIFDQLPVQLEGDTQKFVLNSIDPDARFQKYQRDFVWLENAGVGLKTDLVNEPKSPLLKTAQPSRFKLYQSDTGMLMARYPASVSQAAYLADKHPNLGGIYENVVAQELSAQGHELYYYMTKRRGEVDFVVDGPQCSAVAIEVKSGSYYHSHAALNHVLDTPEYKVDLGIVLSQGNVERDDKVLYLPIYAVFCLPSYLDGEADARGFKLSVAAV